MEKRGEFPKYVNPEVKQVSERTYEQYLWHLAIPDSLLKGKRILDVGAGFSNFAQITNERFGSTGTRAIAVDPVYAFFDKDFNRFKKSLRPSGLDLSFQYGQKPFDGVDFQDWDKAEESFYKDFYKLAKTGNYVAGTHQGLPFANDSIDMIVGHNSIMGWDDREITTRALNECLRVIKPDGEIRLRPSPFQSDEKSDKEVVFSKFGTITKEDFKKMEAGGVIVDEPLLNYFKKLQSDDIKTYVFSVKSDKGLFFGNAIIRKDERIPEIDKNIEDFQDLRVLDFINSPDGYNIRSRIIG